MPVIPPSVEDSEGGAVIDRGYQQAARDIDLIGRKRFTVHALAFILLLTVWHTQTMVWFSVAAVYGVLLFLVPVGLFVAADRQLGTVSLLAARAFLFLYKLYPDRPKKLAGIYFRLAQVLFSQARESVPPYHGELTSRDVNFLRGTPEMKLAERLYKQAQAYEAYFVDADPSDADTHRRNVAIGHQELGYLYRCQRHFDQAIGHLSQAVDLLRELRRSAPDDHHTADALAMSVFRSAEIDHFQGRHSKARERYQEALTLYRQVGNQTEAKLVQEFLSELR